MKNFNRKTAIIFCTVNAIYLTFENQGKCADILSGSCSGFVPSLSNGAFRQMCPFRIFESLTLTHLILKQHIWFELTEFLSSSNLTLIFHVVYRQLLPAPIWCFSISSRTIICLERRSRFIPAEGFMVHFKGLNFG